MEILIVVAIMAVVTKRGVEDILHTARGGTPHRYTAARQRRATGAAGRYWATLWEDTWTDLAAKHVERRDRRATGPAPKVAKPRGAATQFFAGIAQDGRRAARRSWEDGWTRLDERRREKATRPRPGQVTVPGTVVPNAQDETQVRPQDESQDGGQDEDGRPQDEDRPDPTVVPTQDEHPEVDEDGIRLCPSCGNRLATVGTTCPTCITKQETQDDTGFIPVDAIPDNQTTTPLASTTTQEGTPTMTTTIPTGEVAGLSDAIKFSDASAQAFRAQAIATEQTVAALAAGGVTGPAAARFAAAMEKSEAAAADMDAATVELKSHLAVQEAYNANQGAGTREFVTAGQ